MEHEWRVFSPDKELLKSDQELDLSDADSHHFAKVVRLKQGDALLVVCRQSGLEYNAVISSSDNSPLRVRLLAPVPKSECSGKIESCSLALLKGKKNELVIEKLVELGVRNVILWQSSHSVKKLDSRHDRGQIERWQKIAEAAAKQSGKNHVPLVHFRQAAVDLLSLLTSLSKTGDRRFCCSLAESARPIAAFARPEGSIHLMVGPEGGLSSQEEEFFMESGFELVSLMPYRLRSETAAISAAAIVQSLWGPHAGFQPHD